MKKLWIHREIDASAETLWELLTDLEQWPDWGPSIRRADLRGDRFELGATGTVTTIIGLGLPFEVTELVDGEHWGWNVAGLPATDHTVESLGADRCRVGFGVPWAAAAYLSVCTVALQRLARLATQEKVIS